MGNSKWPPPGSRTVPELVVICWCSLRSSHRRGLLGQTCVLLLCPHIHPSQQINSFRCSVCNSRDSRLSWWRMTRHLKPNVWLSGPADEKENSLASGELNLYTLIDSVEKDIELLEQLGMFHIEVINVNAALCTQLRPSPQTPTLFSLEDKLK